MPPVTAPAKKPTPAAKKTATKPVIAKPAPASAPAAPPPAPAETIAVVTDREVIYDTVMAEVYSRETTAGPITETIAEQILGWEDEPTFAARMKADNPSLKPTDPYQQADGTVVTFGQACSFGDNFMLRDEDGNKVKCWNNLDNRPFDERWARGLAQSILNAVWSGPTTFPGETVNGSTIVISRTGKTESGQHSLVAVKLANQIWRKNQDKYPFWKTVTRPDPSFGEVVTGPFIETIVITGVSEDPRVLMTVDNCKQRSTSDVFYTSELFRSLTPNDRKECSRMMATAVDFLWARTDAKGYKTLPEVVGFQDRHKKLLKSVEHIFVENAYKSGRKITSQVIGAGQAAALCYLMGCSGPASDGDDYRNGQPPNEKGLDWTLWDKAKQFWALIGAHPQFQLVRDALTRLPKSIVSPEEGELQGLGGTTAEKLAIIAKAWDVWAAHDPTVGAPLFSAEDLQEGGALWLNYNDLDPDGNKLPDGKLAFLDVANFRGIDVPPDMKSPAASPDPAPPVDLEASKEEVRKARAADTANKIKAINLGKK